MYRSFDGNGHRTKIVDELRYRFPGEQTQVLHGRFEKVSGLNEASGFIVSSWTGRDLYCFVENGIVHSNDLSVPFVSTKEEYFKTANAFLNDLKEQNITKAIFSRIKKCSAELAPETAFQRLTEEYPEAFVYYFRSSLLGTWIGASPEVLCSFENGEFTTMSLAGTLPKNSEKTWTSKELNEQAAVTSFVRKKLSKYGRKISISDRHVVEAGAVCHLRTILSCTISAEQLGDLLNELHPTPAVSGLPRNQAMHLIQKYEKHDRELYTGFLGWKQHDRSSVYVNLRCAKWIGGHYYLFVGGGFTQASVVQDEWEETENKSQTLLKVLQNM